MADNKNQWSVLKWPGGIASALFLFYGTKYEYTLYQIIGLAIAVLVFQIYRIEKNAAQGNTKYAAKAKTDKATYRWAIVLLILGLLLFMAGGFAKNNGEYLIALGLGCIVLMFYLVIKRTKPLPPTRQSSTAHGSAQWSPMSAIINAGYDSKEGLWIGGGYRRKKSGHLLTVAGSGQGKGTCIIIPTLLSDPYGSFVVTDPKGENAFITARFQQSAGQNVFILDPWDEQGKMGAKHGISNSGFNPFTFIKADFDELRDNCELIAYYLVPDSSKDKDPYWNDRSRSMIKTFLMHIVTALPEQDHNFWKLYQLLRLNGQDWTNLLIDMKMNKALDGLISISAGELVSIEAAGNTMAGIKSSAQNATTIFESPQLRRSLEKNDFNPNDLTNGKTTLYVVIPERYLDTHSTWLRLVIGLCLKQCNARPKNRVNFILDEFAVMGKMKDVLRGYAFARGQNIVLWTFIQSLSQLKDIYGEDGMNTFINNAAAFQAFGVKDHYTTDYVSKMLGEGTFEKASDTHSLSGEHHTVSTNYSVYARRIMTPDEVETSPYIITISEGLRMLLTRLPYFGGNVILPTEDWLGVDEQTEQRLKTEVFDLRKALDQFHQRANPPPRVVY